MILCDSHSSNRWAHSGPGPVKHSVANSHVTPIVSRRDQCPKQTTGQSCFFLTVGSRYGPQGYAKVQSIQKAAELAPVALKQLKNPAS